VTPVDKALRDAWDGKAAKGGKRQPPMGAEFPSGEHWAWPSLDPGKWSPNSLLIIYHESGLREEWTYPYMEPYWRLVEQHLEQVFGFPVYLESINAAVSAVYKV
jgi:hypothetical protein